ncbi:MAG: NAD(P)H-dependent oxidoreductase [Erysipelotrichaceae bacterium]|jgi:multimeric flavodoxin WrbA|nr:NAD(P)H-dependent oxidoreductase [Erysipelotrichaceae bacterium]
MKKILFINGSPERQGNTAAIAEALLNGAEAETLSLTDYRINAYGQTLPGDQFEEVLDEMKKADVLIIGSPVYWHNICGSVRNLLDRFYGPVKPGELKGRQLWFIYQGASPEPWMMEAGEYTMKRFAGLYGMEYMGMITSVKEARKQTMGDK